MITSVYIKVFGQIACYLIYIRTLSCSMKTLRVLTCSDEHDVIVAVCSINSIHSDLCEAVRHSCAQEEWTATEWRHWVIHQGVMTRKLDHVIWKAFGGLETSKRLTGTLKSSKRIYYKLL